MAKTKKIKSKTVQKRNALRVTNVAMIGAKFVMPVVPATVMTIINWDEWFAQTNGGLPAGFITLLISTIIAVVGIMKRDDLAKKHVSSIFPFFSTYRCWSGLFMAIKRHVSSWNDVHVYRCSSVCVCY